MSSSLGIAGSIAIAALLVVGVLVYSRSDGTANTSTESALQHAHGMAVDVANPDRLLIATHHGLFQLLNDSDLSRIGTAQDDFMGFTPHPTDPSVFFSSGHPSRGGNLGFQKSTDSGVTWQKVSDGIGGPVDFHSMTVSAVNPDIVYGYYRQLQRSADGGQTWEEAKGMIQPISLSSDPTRESVVYAATQNGVLISEDKGDTWKSLSSQLDGGPVSTFVLKPDATYALTYSLKLGGMGKSTDGGNTWQRVEEIFDGEVVLYIAFSKTDSRVYALTESNSVYKSTDEGLSWVKLAF